MLELSYPKKVSTIRLYFRGLSYNEIAVKTGVAKGIVANIIGELKAGLFPEAANLNEEIETLRELAVDLKQAKITPVQSITGLSLLSTLNQLNIEPSELDKFQPLLKSCATPGADVALVARAALVLDETKRSTGLSISELEAKAISLKEELAGLEPLTEDLRQKRAEFAKLQSVSKKMAAESADAQHHLEQLKEGIKKAKEGETKLAARVTELEGRAYQADKELTEARADLKKLDTLGMSSDDLATFAQQVKEVASHHALKPSEVEHRLAKELKLLDKGLGLETVIKDKNSELTSLKQSVSLFEAKKAALFSSTNQLQAKSDQFQADIEIQMKKLAKTITSIGKVAEQAKVDLANRMISGILVAETEVNRLRDKAMKVGEQVGELNATVAATVWLVDLVALVREEEVKDPGKVRVIARLVLRALSSWVERSGDISVYMLKTYLQSALGEVDRWKPQIALKTS